MAPPISPAASPGPHQPRHACAGEAVETASVATAASAISVFFMAVPFSNARALRSDKSSTYTLNDAMNGRATLGDQSWLHRVILCDAAWEPWERSVNGAMVGFLVAVGVTST